MAWDDDEILILDAKTARWLARLSYVTGDEPRVIVAKILRDIRIDDERAHDTQH